MKTDAYTECRGIGRIEANLSPDGYPGQVGARPKSTPQRTSAPQHTAREPN